MQITFDFAGSRILLDGAEAELLGLIEAVRKIAPNLPQITINHVKPSQVAKALQQDQEDEQRQRSGDRKSMRDFVRALNPKTHAQKIVSIGHFVKEFEGKPSFSPKEMDAWYTACGYTKPSMFPVALSDAKKIRFVANSSWGQWKVDRDGENWVINRLENPSSDGSEKE